MLTYVYAHFPKFIITKADIVMYMIAVLVLEVRLSSVWNSNSKNCKIWRGASSQCMSHAHAGPSLNRVRHYLSAAPPTKMYMIGEALSDCEFPS